MYSELCSPNLPFEPNGLRVGAGTPDAFDTNQDGAADTFAATERTLGGARPLADTLSPADTLSALGGTSPLFPLLSSLRSLVSPIVSPRVSPRSSPLMMMMMNV